VTHSNKWKEFRLDEIALVQGGGTPRRSETAYFCGSIPWVTPTDSLPTGCFLPYTGVKTNVIFFDRPKTQPKSGKMTLQSVWFYKLTTEGFELKQIRKPIEGSQIPDFLKKWKKRVEGENSWTVPVEEIIERGYDLSAKNPNRKDDYEHRPALELVQSIKTKEERIMGPLGDLEGILERTNV